MIAHRAMHQVRGFVALIAPWIAMPGDQRMHPLVVVIVVALLLIGTVTAGHGGFAILREIWPQSQREPDHVLVVHRPNEAVNLTDIRVAKVRFDESGEKGLVTLQFDRQSGRYATPGSA